MKDKNNLLPLAITSGDPAGIGPEIIDQILCCDRLCVDDCVLIGSIPWTEKITEKHGIKSYSVGTADFSVNFGEPSTGSASIALESMKLAARGCIEGLFRGVVTGPVSKYWLKQLDFDFPGQTEFFASSWGGDPTMAFVGQKLLVVLATWHIPLREVSSALDEVCLEKAVKRAHDLALCLGVVCGVALGALCARLFCASRLS